MQASSTTQTTFPPGHEVPPCARPQKSIVVRSDQAVRVLGMLARSGLVLARYRRKERRNLLRHLRAAARRAGQGFHAWTQHQPFEPVTALLAQIFEDRHEFIIVPGLALMRSAPSPVGRRDRLARREQRESGLALRWTLIQIRGYRLFAPRRLDAALHTWSAAQPPCTSVYGATRGPHEFHSRKASGNP